MHQIRVTDQRLSMVDYLRKKQGPHTLAEIHQGVKKSGSDFATVFRFIQVLEKKNLVQQHYWEDSQIRYEINEGHHHYLICRSCQHIEAIEGCVLSEMEKKLQTKNKYIKLSHRLEFFGICPDCQKKKS
ncbi:MAG: transcriptional repressor [Verrucomicrobiota bacterium]